MSRDVNWFKVSHEALEEEVIASLRPSTFKLLIFLMKHQNRFSKEDGFFFRSLENLVIDTRMNLMTILKGINELKELDIITIEKRPNFNNRNSNYYKVNSEVLENPTRIPLTISAIVGSV